MIRLHHIVINEIIHLKIRDVYTFDQQLAGESANEARSIRKIILGVIVNSKKYLRNPYFNL
jgi:hypothetical protein